MSDPDGNPEDRLSRKGGSFDPVSSRKCMISQYAFVFFNGKLI